MKRDEVAALMAGMAPVIKDYVAEQLKTMAPRDGAKIATLEKSVAERDHQLDRLSQHVARLQTKYDTLQSRLHELEKK